MGLDILIWEFRTSFRSLEFYDKNKIIIGGRMKKIKLVVLVIMLLGFLEVQVLPKV